MMPPIRTNGRTRTTRASRIRARRWPPRRMRDRPCSREAFTLPPTPFYLWTCGAPESSSVGRWVRAGRGWAVAQRIGHCELHLEQWNAGCAIHLRSLTPSAGVSFPWGWSELSERPSSRAPLSSAEADFFPACSRILLSSHGAAFFTDLEPLAGATFVRASGRRAELGPHFVDLRVELVERERLVGATRRPRTAARSCRSAPRRYR